MDRRTLKMQNIDREPTIRLSPVAAVVGWRGMRFLRGDEYHRRRDMWIGMQLSAVQKIENGVGAARARYAFRKQQVAERSR